MRVVNQILLAMSEDIFLLPHEKEELFQNGYVRINRFSKEIATEDISKNIGTIIDVRKISPSSFADNVQNLRPRDKEEFKSNTYSAIFGLDAFPAHSDYAHWQNPPRYMMLRCVLGSPFVSTNLMQSTVILKEAYDIAVNAVAVPRRKDVLHKICAMPLVFNKANILGFRWDSVFLKPMNSSAKKIEGVVNSLFAECSKSIALVAPGEFVILDNWRMLHARSLVPTETKERLIERVYFRGLI